jgi:hypothetical protein
MREPLVVSCVERGWQAARTWSLEAAARGTRVVHLIKGRVPADVRALIAPAPRVHLVDVPRPLFWPAVALVTSAAWALRRLDRILVDHDKTARRLGAWVRRAGVPLCTARLGASGTVELEPCASR